MSQHQIRIQPSPVPGSSKIVLDEEDISGTLSGYTLTDSAHRGALLTLQLGWTTKALISGAAEIEIDSATLTLLRQLGWTPPPEAQRCIVVPGGKHTAFHATPHTCFLRNTP